MEEVAGDAVEQGDDGITNDFSRPTRYGKRDAEAIECDGEGGENGEDEQKD